MTEPEFAEILDFLAGIYRDEFSPDQMECWYTALGRENGEVLLRAARELAREFPRMPSPADLLSRIRVIEASDLALASEEARARGIDPNPDPFVLEEKDGRVVAFRRPVVKK